MQPSEVDFSTWSRVNALLHAYCDGLDRADIEAVAQVFAVDGVWNYAPGELKRGRDAIREFLYAGMHRFAHTSHHVGPAQVALQADGRLESVAYFMAVHQLKDGGRYTVHGRYVDRLAITGDAMLIAERSVLAHVTEGTNRTYTFVERVAHDAGRNDGGASSLEGTHT